MQVNKTIIFTNHFQTHITLNLNIHKAKSNNLDSVQGDAQSFRGIFLDPANEHENDGEYSLYKSIYNKLLADRTKRNP
jgi:hypothetical protein